jgi:hypothetical protein
LLKSIWAPVRRRRPTFFGPAAALVSQLHSVTVAHARLIKPAEIRHRRRVQAKLTFAATIQRLPVPVA